MNSAIYQGTGWTLPIGQRLARWLGTGLLIAAGAANVSAATVTTLGGSEPGFSYGPGFVNGDTAAAALFNGPAGVALNTTNTLLFVADQNNNAIRVLDLPNHKTSTFTVNKISQPVGVAVDATNNVYVLNRGTGNNGTIIKFDRFGNFKATNAMQLTNATAIAIDGLNTLYATVQSNRIIRVSSGGAISTVAIIPSAIITTNFTTLTNRAISLQGITVLDNGFLAVTDAGSHGIWLVNPLSGIYTQFTGFNGAGDTFGDSFDAQLNRPYGIATAGNGILIVTDRGNNRVKYVDPDGTVEHLYGIPTFEWYPGEVTPGLFDGEACQEGFSTCAEARQPYGVVVARNGDIYTTESYYHIIRQTTDTGLAGPNAVPGVPPLFNSPKGVTLDNQNAYLYIADQNNNVIRRLNLANNLTTTFLTNMNAPVALLFDSSDNLFVLNQGTGVNGTIYEFNKFGNLVGTNASGLALPTAFTRDNSGYFYITEQGGTIKRVTPTSTNVIATVASPGVQLSGIALFDDGTIAVSDSGEHLIWRIDPITMAVSYLTGLTNNPGNGIGIPGFAQLNQPQQIARAAGNLLVVADEGNNRIVTVDAAGNLAEIASTGSLVWFGTTGDPVSSNNVSKFVNMTQPVGIALGDSGSVYTSEIFYDNLRKTLGTGLSAPGAGGGGNNGTNGIVVVPPVVSPNSGYYPMGRILTVQTINTNVHYTLNGTEPTPASPTLPINGVTGIINWYSTTNDLSFLRLKAFVGTNASVTAGGIPALTNTIGVPPDVNSVLRAGVGSTLIIPVVVNLTTNDQIKSYQFDLEITPVGHTNMISDQFLPLDVETNGFIQVVTDAQGDSASTNMFNLYNDQAAHKRGIEIAAIGSGSHVLIQHFAVVAMVQVPIPNDAVEGQLYSIVVTNASATSDAGQATVSLTPMPPAIIMVTNVPYAVGDISATHWFNAGSFGNGTLDNADVNTAFYASAGVRVPYTLSDAYNAMDVFPQDVGPGIAGGDGLIGYNDWQIILQRSLNIAPYTNNWLRAWASNGDITNAPTTLVLGGLPDAGTDWASLAPWYKEALIGAVSVGNVTPGTIVNVPVFCKLVNGVSVSGLQFRAIVTPNGFAPPLDQQVQFINGASLSGALYTGTAKTAEIAAGWTIGNNPYGSRSSNYLGVVRVTIPSSAQPGQSYTVTFANVGGAPDLATAYEFESGRAVIVVGAPAPVSTDICSDDWKKHFFGSVTNQFAAGNVDADGDGVPNNQEFLAGTDPTDASSYLRFDKSQWRINAGQKQLAIQWLTAPGRLYELQYATSPNGTNWTSLGTLSGNGAIGESVEPNPAAAARFYRLRILP